MNKLRFKLMKVLAIVIACTLAITSVPFMSADAAKKAVRVKKIQITSAKKTLNLVRGQTHKLKIKVTPAKAKNKKVSYKSNNTKVATVNSKGNIAAKGNGSAKITIKAKDGSKKKATLTVKVTTLVSGVILPSTSTVEVDKTVTLSASVLPNNASNKALSWTTSDAGIATVTADGVVKGIKAGTAVISAKARDKGGKSADCTVTVTGNNIITPTPVPGVKVTGIEIKTPPKRVAYYSNEDVFDATGMVIMANYSNGTQKEVTAVQTVPQPSQKLSTTNARNGVTISYTEGTETVTAVVDSIRVISIPSASKIDIEKEPTKVEYTEDETFSPAGMVVKATYSGVIITDVNEIPKDTTAIVTSDITYPTTALTPFDTSVTISYAFKGTPAVTAVQAIKVAGKNPLKSLSASFKGAGRVFPRAQMGFLDEDITIIATYNDNTTKELKVAECIIKDAVTGGLFTTATTSAKISYTYGGLTREATLSGFTVTTYIETYTFDDAENCGTVVKRENENGNAIPLEQYATDVKLEFVPGLKGNAMKMDGTYGVRMDKISGAPTKSYSVAAWIKPEELKNHQSLIITTASEFGLTGKAAESWASLAGNISGSMNALKIWSMGPQIGGHTTLPDSPAITMGEDAEWIHIAMVVDGEKDADGEPVEKGFGYAKLFVNGELKSQGMVQNEKEGRMANDGKTFLEMKTYFGANGWTADGYFKGLVDEFVFTNEVLSDERVEALYEELK